MQVRLKILITIIILIALFSAHLVNAQRNTTSRIRINSGDNIDFLFRTFNDMQNGKSFNNWTTIYIYFNDTTPGPTPAGSGWQLEFRADDTDFVGVGGNTLNLAILELKASGPATGPNGETITYSNTTELQDVDQVLILGDIQNQGNGPYSDNFFISYYCGQQISLGGESVWSQKGDYYNVNIIFTLSPQ